MKEIIKSIQEKHPGSEVIQLNVFSLSQEHVIVNNEMDKAIADSIREAEEKNIFEEFK